MTYIVHLCSSAAIFRMQGLKTPIWMTSALFYWCDVGEEKIEDSDKCEALVVFPDRLDVARYFIKPHSKKACNGDYCRRKDYSNDSIQY
jgi:hypothetical protein